MLREGLEGSCRLPGSSARGLEGAEEPLFVTGARCGTGPVSLGSSCEHGAFKTIR